MKILFKILIAYFLYSLFLIIKDKYSKNIADKPLYLIKTPLIAKPFLFAIFYRPIEPIIHYINTFKEEVRKDKIEKELREKEKERELKKIGEQIDKELKKTEQQQKYIKNYHLIEENNGIMPIKGNEIGEISINKKTNTIKIQIKQITRPQIIDSFEGLIICKNSKYTIGETKINGGVFEIDQVSSDNNHKIFINNNRQGIKIECSEIELQNYKNKHITVEEYRNLYTRSLCGGFFLIKEK